MYVCTLLLLPLLRSSCCCSSSVSISSIGSTAIVVLTQVAPTWLSYDW